MYVQGITSQIVSTEVQIFTITTIQSMGLTNTSNTTPELEKGLQSLAETFVDQKTLGYLLETLDHVRIEKVSNKRYQTKKKENILLVNTDTNAI